MRVFLDANVLFSASNKNSIIARLISLSIEVADVVTSDIAYEEARRNLVLKREAWLPAFERLCEDIRIVPSARFDIGVRLDEKDLPILCAAIRSKCNYFVTGDKRDFRHLYDKKVRGVEIISLLRLSEIISE